jgi:hypothetical protein
MTQKRTLLNIEGHEALAAQVHGVVESTLRAAARTKESQD